LCSRRAASDFDHPMSSISRFNSALSGCILKIVLDQPFAFSLSRNNMTMSQGMGNRKSEPATVISIIVTPTHPERIYRIQLLL
jgi:hypothetical protein